MSYAQLENFIQEFILGQSGAHRVAIALFKRLGGGAIQENYALDVRIEGGPLAGRHEWVLRTDSPSSLPLSLSRAEEFAVLQAAFAAGARVPAPLWLHRDQGQLGKDFYLMHRINGEAAGHKLVRGSSTSGQRLALLNQLGQSLAALHQVVPPHAGLDFLDDPPTNPALLRIHQYRQLLDNLNRPQPVLEWALRWLELNAPTTSTVCLTHGDFRTGNYMVDNSQLSGILDWEFASWSAPEEDIGWFTARCWRFGSLAEEAGGLGPLEAFLEGYESTAGRTVDRSVLPYWRIMASLRWAVIALLQAERHLSGEQRSLELALTGRMLPEIELDLIDEISALEKRHA